MEESIVKNALADHGSFAPAVSELGLGPTLNTAMEVFRDNARARALSSSYRRNDVGDQDDLHGVQTLAADEAEALLEIAPPGDPRSARAHIFALEEFNFPPGRSMLRYHTADEKIVDSPFHRIVEATESVEVLQRAAEYRPDLFYSSIVERIAELSEQHKTSGHPDKESYDTMQSMLVSIAETARSHIWIGVDHGSDFPERELDIMFEVTDDPKGMAQTLFDSYVNDFSSVPDKMLTYLLNRGDICPKAAVDAAVWSKDTLELAVAHSHADELTLASAEIMRRGVGRAVEHPSAVRCGRFRNTWEDGWQQCRNRFKKGRDVDWCGRCQGTPFSAIETARSELPAGYVPASDPEIEGLRCAHHDILHPPAAVSEWRDALSQIDANSKASRPTEPDRFHDMCAAVHRGITGKSVRSYEKESQSAGIATFANAKTRQRAQAIVGSDRYSAIVCYPKGYDSGSRMDSLPISTSVMEAAADKKIDLHGAYEVDGKLCLDVSDGASATAPSDALAAQQYAGGANTPNSFASIPRVISSLDDHFKIEADTGQLGVPRHGAVVTVNRKALLDFMRQAREDRGYPYHTLTFVIDHQTGESRMELSSGRWSSEAPLCRENIGKARKRFSHKMRENDEDGSTEYSLDSHHLSTILKATKDIGSDDLKIGVPFGCDNRRLSTIPAVMQLGEDTLGVIMPYRQALG